MPITEIDVVLGRNANGDNVFARPVKHQQIILPLAPYSDAADIELLIQNPGYDWMIALLHVTAEDGAQVVTQDVFPYSLILDDYTNAIAANGLMDEPDTFSAGEVATPWTTVFKYVFGPGASDATVLTWNGSRDFVNGPLPPRFMWSFTHSTSAVLTYGIEAVLGFGSLS